MLKAILDSLDGLDPAIAALYTEQTTGEATVYVLQVEGVEKHPKVTALKNAHDTTKRERNEFRDQLKAAKEKLDGLGEDFDPEEFHRLKAEEEARKAGGGNPDAEKDIEAKVNARLKIAQDRWDREKAKLETDLAAASKRAEGAETDLRGRIKMDALSQALDAVGVTRPGLRRGAVAVHIGRLHIDEDDGNARILYETEEGAKIDLREAITHWAGGDDGKLYVTPPTGGGAPGSGQPRSGKTNPFRKDTLNLTEQGRLTRENPALAARLKSEAQAS